jgi:hypothetical protein
MFLKPGLCLRIALNESKNSAFLVFNSKFPVGKIQLKMKNTDELNLAIRPCFLHFKEVKEFLFFNL